MTSSPHRFGIGPRFAVVATLVAALAAPALGQEGGGPESGSANGEAEAFALDLPAQSLGDTLQAISERSGAQLLYGAELVADRESPAVAGEMTVGEALERALADSGLGYRPTAEDTYAITSKQRATRADDPARLDGAATRPDPGEAKLPETVVTGSPLGEERYKAESATTATRTNTPIMDFPGSIQVVPREVIDDQNAQDLREVVRNVSGVFMENSFGGIGHDFTIRGFNQDFKLRNGFRENSDIAARRVQDLANVERVEVLKGPASITSGRLAPGGIINIVTKKPTAQPLYRFELDGGATSEGGGSVEPSIDLGGPLTENGKVKYRLNALYSHKDSFREPFNQDFQRFFIAPALSFDLGPETDLLVELEYTHDERPFDRGIVHFDGHFSDRDRNLQSDTVFNESESFVGSYTFEHELADNIKFRHRSQFMWLDQFNLENVAFAPATDFPGSFPNAVRGDFARFVGSNDRILRNYSTQSELHANLDGVLAEHDLLFAFDFSRDEFEGVFQSTDSSFAFPELGGVKNKINIFDPNDQVPAPTREDLTFVSQDVENVTDELGLLLQDQITLSDQWKVLLGGRVSWVDQESEDSVAGTEDAQRTDAVFSPRAGVVYKPIEPVSLYTSYVESFEPNDARNREGKLLDPTEGEQFEAGVKAELLDRRLRATLAGFQITKTNIPRSVSGPGGSFSVPTGEQRSRGVELDVTGRIHEGWTVIGSYAFIDTEITEDETNEGNELRGVPTHSASLWSNYEFRTGRLEGLELGAGVFFRGEREADTANSFELPSFTRVDARIGYERDNWKVDLTLKNLFDTDDNFEAVDFGPLVKPGIPFTAIASVSVQF